MGEGNVLTRVCLSVHRGEVSPQSSRGGGGEVQLVGSGGGQSSVQPGGGGEVQLVGSGGGQSSVQPGGGVSQDRTTE